MKLASYLDLAGIPIENATVEIYEVGGDEPIASTTTDERGRWEEVDLPKGAYRVKLIHNGLVRWIEPDNKLQFDKIYGLDLVTAPFPPGSVTGEQLKDGAIDTRHLQDGIITAEHILNGSITGSNLAPGSVLPGDIGDGAIGPGSIKDGTITSEKIALGSIPPRKFAFAFGTVSASNATKLEALSERTTNNLGVYTKRFVVGVQGTVRATLSVMGSGKYVVSINDLTNASIIGRVPVWLDDFGIAKSFSSSTYQTFTWTVSVTPGDAVLVAIRADKGQVAWIKDVRLGWTLVDDDIESAVLLD